MIEELEFADNKNIAVVREKLHHYRWMASKLIGIYGDKQEIKQDTNIQITGAIPIKRITKTLQTPLVETGKQCLAHDMRYVQL